jgi:hypothetical protein
MTRCIIHIGMHKTGSTSLQRSLDGFRNDRFVYADLSRDPNHSLAIFSAFSANPARHHLHSTRDDAGVNAYIRKIRRELERSISATHGRTLLISGEDIGVLPARDLAPLKDFFRERFDDVMIVGYVRPPAGFITSSFQERVKNGSVTSLAIDSFYRNYQTSFEKFDEVFGRENVHLWKFDPTRFPGGCVVQDFCARLGIAFPSERIVRMNESLSRRAVAMLYTYRKLGPQVGAPRMRGRFAMTLGNLLGDAGGKFRFSPDTLRPVLEKNRADTEWMEARLGESLGEDLGENRPGDVHDETDLLRPDPATAAALLSLLGGAEPEGIKGETSEEVALLVHALRMTRVPEDPELTAAAAKGQAGPVAAPPAVSMPISQLIDEMQRSDPAALNGIPRSEAQALVRNVFRHMGAALAKSDEGVVAYPGLGRFRVRKVEREVDGKKVAEIRIGFQPAAQGVQEI